MRATNWIAFACLCVALVTVPGCRSSAPVELVDLNKVLDILATMLGEPGANDAPVVADAPDGAAPDELFGGPAVATVQGEVDSEAAVGLVPIAPAEQDPDEEKKFCADFATRLNAAALISKPIGVSMDEKGDLLGFTDANKNNTQDAGDEKLFTIEIDAAGGRLIASDNQGNHRPHHYRSHGFTGFLLGSMMGRQNSYYSGDRASQKPNYSGRSMSPSNYHSAAVSKARAASSSFRSSSSSSSSRARSGSGGFSFGK
ncbi:MAG: hypothetical protein R3C53_01315 [Pirellulaceae bacterium]